MKIKPINVVTNHVLTTYRHFSYVDIYLKGPHITSNHYEICAKILLYGIVFVCLLN